MARKPIQQQVVQFTLTAGIGGIPEKSEASQAATFTVDGNSFDTELLQAAGVAWLQSRGYEGTVTNPRITADGVTANAEGRVSRRKGRVKVASNGYSGDLWVRDAKSTRSSARAGKMAKMEAALIAAGIDPNSL